MSVVRDATSDHLMSVDIIPTEGDDNHKVIHYLCALYTHKPILIFKL